MEALISALPGLVDLVQNAGVVGVLLLVCGVLVYEVKRLRAELVLAYRGRDKWRLAYTVCKSACDEAHIKIDLSDLADLDTA